MSHPTKISLFSGCILESARIWQPPANITDHTSSAWIYTSQIIHQAHIYIYITDYASSVYIYITDYTSRMKVIYTSTHQELKLQVTSYKVYDCKFKFTGYKFQVHCFRAFRMNSHGMCWIIMEAALWVDDLLKNEIAEHPLDHP